MRKKITVKDLQNFKGNKKLVCILVKNIEEALAADKVGFEMLATGVAGEYKNDDGHPEFDELVKMREAAPTAFMHCGAPDSLIPTLDEAKQFSFKILEHGFDMLYCNTRFDLIKELYKEGIPCLGHVGLVPPKRTWTGGFVAVGKTASEAMWIYDQCLKIEDAGGVAIEMECVPYKVAEAISKKVKPTVMSMGSGPGCDVEYVFGCDILGSTKGHIPRHAKKYRDFQQEFVRLQHERENAFQEFYDDVHAGSFPEKKNIVEIDENELDTFLNKLEHRD